MTMDLWAIATIALLALVLGAVLFRHPLLKLIGHELWPIEPQRTAREELLSSFDELEREGGTVTQDRARVGGLLDLHEL